MGTLAEQLEQKLNDDEAFRANFDRNSATYHNGITTAVPTNAVKAVPKGMEADADWMSLPVQDAAPTTADYGPAYAATMARRTMLTDLKKAMSAITTHTAAILRYQANKAKAEAGEEFEGTVSVDAAKVEKWEKFLRRERNRRDKAIRECRAFYEKGPFPAESTEEGAWIETITAAATEWTDKTEHVAFIAKVKEATTSIFSETQALLQQLKREKKEYLAAQAAETEETGVDAANDGEAKENEAVAAVAAVSVEDAADDAVTK